MGWNTRIAIRGGLIEGAERQLRGTNRPRMESKPLLRDFAIQEIPDAGARAFF
jgi:hypothetical protein